MPRPSGGTIVACLAVASCCAVFDQFLSLVWAHPGAHLRLSSSRKPARQDHHLSSAGSGLAGEGARHCQHWALVDATVAGAAAAAALVMRRAASGEAQAAEAEEREETASKKKAWTPTADWKRDNPAKFEALDAKTKYVVGMYAYAEEWNENPEKFRKIFQPSEQLGATDPLGFFDPLSFSKVGDKECFRRYRELELKHGRVAMLASAGAVAQCLFKIPGFEEVPDGMGALITPPGTYGFLALLLVTGALEIYLQKNPVKEEYSLNLDVGEQSNRRSFFVGDDFLAIDYFHECELNNGRFAMITALGIIAAELASGMNAVKQLERMGLAGLAI
mmetsp:Transcript_70092/g.193909  ORF Transcript_70092/g.193909 Transcript_70092/m.193909 type:complete len:333 (-) Transcript_70092:74-1072(-)